LRDDELLKVVFDTNVYISSFITRQGRAEQAWKLAVERKIEAYTSAAILTEMAQKLREKFFWDDEKIKSAVRHIGKGTRIVKPNRKLSILVDEPDNRILECAQYAGAEFIVTGDRHLLHMNAFSGIKIISIADFLRVIEGTDLP